MDSLDILLRAAEGVMENAVAQYSGFKVGVAILSEDGRVFTGCNIENPSIMLTICAERVALGKAISESAGRIVSIAIVSNKGEYCYPCGSCRQMLFEFAPEVSVHLASKAGIKTYKISELLPFPFVKD